MKIRCKGINANNKRCNNKNTKEGYCDAHENQRYLTCKFYVKEAFDYCPHPAVQNGYCQRHIKKGLPMSASSKLLGAISIFLGTCAVVIFLKVISYNAPTFISIAVTLIGALAIPASFGLAIKFYNQN